MALNLSDLTGSSTSGDILAEAQTTADFLDSVPLLKNLADPSGATDAKQFTATKQPIALPLIDGEGYCYLPPVAGNYASTPDSSELDITGDITIECDFIVPESPLSANRALVAKYNTNTNNRSYSLIINASGVIALTLSEDGTYNANFAKGRDFSSVLSGKTRATVKVTWRQSDGLTQFFIKGSDGSFTQVGDDLTIAATSIYNGNQEVEIGSTNSGVSNVGSSIGVFGARIYASVDGTDKRLDIDFTSPRIPHGATEFECETGQVVTVNTSGDNPSKVIKKPVLRFDGVDDFMDGVLGQSITGGYMFIAFSVNGGGSDTFNRVFSVNKEGVGSDSSGTGVIFAQHSSSGTLRSFYGAPLTSHGLLYDDDNGDILHEVKILSGDHLGLVNNADARTSTLSTTIDSDHYNIATNETGVATTATIDLEYLALFPATLTDSQADQIRNYINNRNSVFLRHDTDGYYFFDGAATYDGQVFTGSGSWNGRIVGSDNGDADFYISQNTLDDRPTTDGYKITFADNSDHFDIPSTTQAGWQIVGTSLGTFAYKVDSDAITELNLLGNAAIGDGLNYRSVGDLYGIILLPESATNRDIEEARKLLIDRGASDGVATTSLFAAWYSRRDIVEFKHLDTSNVTFAQSAWSTNDALQSFPALDLSNSTSFVSAWQNTSSLTQFPQGAKLGTERTNVNFSYAWRSSGLTSFPALDLSSGNNFTSAWQSCSSLTQFPQDAKLGTEATNVNFTSAWRESGLTSFSTPLPTASRVDYAWYNNTSLSSFTTTDLKNCSNFDSAWRGTSSLKSFPNAQLGTEATNVNFQDAWRDSGLTSFPALDLSKGTNLTRGWFYTPLTSFGAIDASNSTNFSSAWHGTALLTSFPQDAKLGTETSSAIFNQTWHSCGLQSFSTPLQKGRYFYAAWFNNTSLTDFSADVFANWNPDSITNGIFNLTWDGCTSLTAQSVENILVPIAASGKHATDNGTSGGTALTDATIDIDYDVTTGSLTAATLSAIETLNGRGWSVNINNEIIVPNILQLQPAAAYSLRSFDADADPTVVNVRRSSDGALSDFTASQVSDGTLTSWVNTDVDLVTPTLNNGGFEDGLTGWAGSGRVLDTTTAYAGSNSVLLDVVNGAWSSVSKTDVIEEGKEYRLSFYVKISDASNNLKVQNGATVILVTPETTDWEYHEVTLTGDTSPTLTIARATTTGDYTINIDNITLTQLTADGYVTTFYDQSTNGRDSTQSTASAQPLIVENGVLLTDSSGNPAIVGDGVDDTLIHPTLTNELDSSDFLVTAAYKDELIMGIDGSVPRLYMSQSSMSYNTLGTVGYASQTGRNILSFQVLGNTQEVFGNGTSLGTATETQVDIGQSMFNVLRAGSGFSSGPLMEVLVFGNDQSANRAAIENNINDHYSIY